MRVIRDGLEARYQQPVGHEHPCLPWLVRHAAGVISRLQGGADGKTGYERLSGKTFKGERVELGKCVWYLKPKSKGLHKLSCRWDTGVWLGFRDESGEVFMGTPNGVIKVRTVRRKGSHEARWSDEVFGSMSKGFRALRRESVREVSRARCTPSWPP